MKASNLYKKIVVGALSATILFAGAEAVNAQHIVKKGDTLFTISVQYNMTLTDIIDLNPQFEDPNSIHVGDKVVVRTSDIATDLVDYARSLQDRTTYVYGGQENYSPPLNTDCSGWTQHIYYMFGIDLPRTSAEQANVGTPVTFENLKKGDLMFFSTREDKVITHVGIYMGNDYWISNLSTKDDVEILSTWGSWTQKHFMWAQRVL